MLKFVRFEFERHIEFVLDCIEEARPLNWPGAARTRLARTVDYEFFRTIDTNKHCISLLSLRNKTIGFVWYDIEFNTIEGQKYCHLDFIYLLPEFRGRGYGKYVMEKIEQMACSCNASVLSLEVTIANAPALGLYEYAGYRPDRYIMKKKLQPKTVPQKSKPTR